MNQFAIGYVFNPTLNVKKVFREISEKCFKEIILPSNLPGIRNSI